MPHDPIRRHQKIEARISVRPNGCHEWTGAKQVAGYGQIMINYKRLMAHRYMWEHHNGPIPEKHDIHHICENPACVNPEHLEAVTRAEHVQRHPKNWSKFHMRTGCKNGHAIVAGNWKINAQGRWVCLDCKSVADARHRLKQGRRIRERARQLLSREANL